jgi:muconolactone delta-isomerase
LEEEDWGGGLVKFLVLWSFQAGIRVGLPEVAKIISNLQDYAKELEGQKKLERYYHVVGRHGGAWIFDVKSNEELEILLAKMPVYNFAKYKVYPLSEMKTP